MSSQASVEVTARSEFVPAPPEELYLETTNRCNLRCRTCPQSWGMLEDAADLSPAQVRRILGYFPAVRRVVLHGIGEPLLNPELPGILREVKGTGAHALFNTNGLLLRGRIARGLVEEGLDELRVSLDSATAGTYAAIRGVDGLGRIVENIRAFNALKRALGRSKPEVSLWLTGMKMNISELPALVGLAAEIGVARVHLQRLVFSERGLAIAGQSLVSAPSPADLQAIAQAEALAARAGVSLHGSGEVGPGDLLTHPGGADRAYRRCRRPWNLMYVTANGNVLPCCIAPFTGVPYGSIVLGNIFKQTVEDIWNGDLYRRWRRSMLDGEPSAACVGCGANWSL